MNDVHAIANRVKSAEEKWDPSHSKYILLRQCAIAKRARGHSEGVLTKAEFGPTGMLITADCGFFIDLKVCLFCNEKVES